MDLLRRYMIEKLIALHRSSVFYFHCIHYNIFLKLIVDIIQIINILCQNLYQVIWKLQRLHLDPELLELLNGLLDLKDRRSLLDSGQVETPLHVHKPDLQVKSLFISVTSRQGACACSMDTLRYHLLYILLVMQVAHAYFLPIYSTLFRFRLWGLRRNIDVWFIYTLLHFLVKVGARKPHLS